MPSILCLLFNLPNILMKHTLLFYLTVKEIEAYTLPQITE